VLLRVRQARAGCQNPFNDMAPDKISVVIPCFNASRFIAATIDSVLAQKGVELEVIVVDDGSSDGSARTVRSAYPEVRVFEQPNHGVAVARNTGIQQSRHDWIAFVDADDIWLPDKLALQAELLATDPEARMAYTAWHVWPTAEVLPTPALLDELQSAASDVARWAGAAGWIYPQLLLDCVVWTSTVLAHRSVFDEVGGFNTDLRVGEDYDLWLRASRVTPILQVARPLALYRMHPGSITRRVPEQNFKGRVISSALNKWGYACPRGGVASRAEVDRGLARSWTDYAGAHLIAGHAIIARQAAMTAVRIQPGQLLAWKVLAKSLAASVTARSHTRS